MWWSEGQRGCCEAVGGKIMMLVMWVMLVRLFSILVIPLVLVVLVVRYGGAKDK